MGKKEFKEYICRPFCRFFREGQKEEMACRGAQVIELLIEHGQLDSKKLPRNGKDPCLWEQHDSDLETTVCQNCPFFAHDCDFQSKNKLPGSEPCGGYILLCLLKKNGIVIIDDLEKTIGE